jgi:hypothetical protein
MSRSVDIAQGVVDRINGGTYSQAFTAEVTFSPIAVRQDNVFVGVEPAGGMTYERGSRCPKRMLEYQMAVRVTRTMTPDDNHRFSTADMDLMMSVCEEIVDQLASSEEHLAGYPWNSIERQELYDGEILMEHHLFAAEILITFPKIEE